MSTAVVSTPSDAAPRNPVVLAVAGFLVGVLFGAVATIGHRHVLRIGDVAIPWGLVAALAGVAALLIGLRLLAGRLAAGAAALGVIAIVALFSLPGLGGSILVPGTTVGTIWAVGPALISVFVVAWPSASAFRRGGPTARADIMSSATTPSHAS